LKGIGKIISSQTKTTATLDKTLLIWYFHMMTEHESRLPDNAWFPGEQVASWEGSRFGYRALFEAIVDPASFSEVCNSAGHDELIELFEPADQDSLSITMLGEDDKPLGDPLVLSAEMPATILPHGSRFLLDATASSEPFAYTCVIYGEKPLRLDSFEYGGRDRPVTFIEKLFVKEGVDCDVYEFDGDSSRDLGIIRVTNGSSTPLQRVMDGDVTIEGHISGKGSLIVARTNGNREKYNFSNDGPYRPVQVDIGDTMRWTAEEDLVFYEVCEPPYAEGRFQDLS
jgi:hypothetical protein